MDEARRLAGERAERRSAGDFAAADALRERIRALGFEVEDRPEGSFELHPAASAPATSVRPDEVPSALGESPDRDWTLHWLAEKWPRDVARGVASFGDDVQHVVVEDERTAPFSSSYVSHNGTHREKNARDVEVVRLAGEPGFGASRNAGLRRSRGRFVAVVDGSIEATGDVLGPLAAALTDPRTGVAGPFGVVSDDLRSFRETDAGEVDAIEGYLLAFRRELLERGLAFNERYRFYRHADLDLSFQAKAMGLRCVRLDLPVRRHEHRAWEAMPERREALSKRNFYRFLDAWRARTDLLMRG